MAATLIGMTIALYATREAGRMIRGPFVGCGGMAAHYLGVYRDLTARVVNCIDAVRARPKGCGRLRRVAATDYAAALTGEMDAVIISSPNHLHRPQAVAAIEASTCCCKPVAPNLADAEAMQPRPRNPAYRRLVQVFRPALIRPARYGAAAGSERRARLRTPDAQGRHDVVGG